MRNYLNAVAGFLIFLLLFSCKDEEKDLKEKGYSIFCWPSKTPCDSREYGLEFSYTVVRFDIAAGKVSEERVATLICCSYIQELMDTLTAYNDTLKQHRNRPLSNLDKRCSIGPYDVFVNMNINWAKGTSVSFFGFTDTSNPTGFTMYVPQLDAFEDFRKEVLSKYKRCCLREQDEEQ